MAIAAVAGSGAIIRAGGGSVIPTSAIAGIVQAVSDTTATAASAAELISPMTYGGTNCRWIKVGSYGGKAQFRCVYHVSTDMTTPPIIYVIGANAPDGTEPAVQFANDGTLPWERLDALSGVAGITLTRVAATDQKSTANRYTPWYSFTSPYTGVVGDLNGCTHILVLCSQASVGGTGTVEVKIIN